jgi:hypothetical protein
MYQYYITYVDTADNLWLDSVIPQTADGRKGWSWDAYSPHTTGKGRTCESCHENPKAAGMGIKFVQAADAAHPISIPSDPVVPEARLLNKDEQQKLLLKSDLYKKWKATFLRKSGIDSLFMD